MILEQATFETFGHYPSELTPKSGKRILAACDECGEIREIPNSAYRSLCMSCAHKGKRNYNFGKQRSETIKTKISVANKGRRHTKEEKAKISAAKKGKKRKPFTEETKAKMSASALGKVISGEQRAKISISKKGKYTGEKSSCWKPKVKCTCLQCGKEFEVHSYTIKNGEGKYCCIICRAKAQFRGGKKLTWARCNARRKRDLGYIPVNSYFESCEGHHITHNFVIYIPKELHKSVWHNLNTGQGMEAINTLALDFLVNGF